VARGRPERVEPVLGGRVQRGLPERRGHGSGQSAGED
jgi:hypothetical protein